MDLLFEFALVSAALSLSAPIASAAYSTSSVQTNMQAPIPDMVVALVHDNINMSHRDLAELLRLKISQYNPLDQLIVVVYDPIYSANKHAIYACHYLLYLAENKKSIAMAFGEPLSNRDCKRSRSIISNIQSDDILTKYGRNLYRSSDSKLIPFDSQYFLRLMIRLAEDELCKSVGLLAAIDISASFYFTSMDHNCVEYGTGFFNRKMESPKRGTFSWVTEKLQHLIIGG